MSRILLHSCCAPCSGAILEHLTAQGSKPVVFFSNSNIDTRGEYDLRLGEIRRYCAKLGLELVEDEYDHNAWLEAVRGLEAEPERGARCSECFRFRLRRAAEYAAAHGFDLVTTSLASSRWKDLDQVNAVGEEVFEGCPAGFWAADWRKGGLQPRRSEIIREEGFYNQNYCGCEFSKASGMVVVTPQGGSDARVELFEKERGRWTRTLETSAFIGREGVGKEREGDMKTPVGVFGITTAFGIKPDPGTRLPYLDIDDRVWCSGEPGPEYNRFVNHPCDGEHMIEYAPEYDYGFFPDYNKEGIYPRGSAVFFHVKGSKPYTAGCVALDGKDMETLLKALGPDSVVVIRDSD